MKRGELWTLAGSGPYSSKPRPVVVVQDSLFDATDSITVCPLTSDPEELSLFRIAVVPAASNGLAVESRVMADKVTTVRRAGLGRRIGELAEGQLAEVSRALIVFLGLTDIPEVPAR